ncbi:serine/arginine repetitive matrix protein 1-like isoform X2 [Rhinolophus ferrumequinum]|uniref:serine/arginine repetitive matrix protein 1-like isoform X2 n=1 Tax=Rhinolophus ferrumequinum TaxID=59479 RepID=UPI00140FCE10|nr:serine/arginine repetitive matrix protein 1-like isoform X2 [Rhinolophus ferrumequinum]
MQGPKPAGEIKCRWALPCRGSEARFQPETGHASHSGRGDLRGRGRPRSPPGWGAPGQRPGRVWARRPPRGARGPRPRPCRRVDLPAPCSRSPPPPLSRRSPTLPDGANSTPGRQPSRASTIKIN